MLHHKNKVIGKLFSEKLKDTLESYEAKNLKDIDKKLLRGLNEKQHFDHDEGKDKIMLTIKKYILMKMEEIRESMGNDTLLGNEASYKQLNKDDASNPFNMLAAMRRASIKQPMPTKEQLIEMQDMGFLKEANDSFSMPTTDRPMLRTNRPTSKILVKDKIEANNDDTQDINFDWPATVNHKKDIVSTQSSKLDTNMGFGKQSNNTLATTTLRKKETAFSKQNDSEAFNTFIDDGDEEHLDSSSILESGEDKDANIDSKDSWFG